MLFDAGHIPGAAWILHTAFVKLSATYNAPEALAISVAMRYNAKVGKEHGIFCGVSACADRPIVNTFVHFHERVKPRLDDNLLISQMHSADSDYGLPESEVVPHPRTRQWTARRRQWTAG